MHRLSIVIPYLGDLPRLEDTLVSVLENRPADCQVLVVLSKPYEDPYDLAEEVRFVPAEKGSSLADCVRLGIEAAEAPIVHVLACGVEATPDWVEAALSHFDEPDVAAVAPVVVNRFNKDQILSAGLRYTPGGSIRRLGKGQRVERFAPSQKTLCGADLLASFYRKAALEAVGPWVDHVPDWMAGADWALALRHAGFRCIQEPASVTAAGNEVLAPQSELAEGFSAERLFWRWAPLAGWGRSLLSHLVVVLVECLLCLVRPANIFRLLGRLRGSLQFASYRPHWRQIEQPLVASGPAIGPPHFVAAEHRQSLPSRMAG